MEHILGVTSLFLIEMFLYLQAMFVVYLQYILMTHKLSFRFRFTHSFILLLFIGLKFRIIPYELGGSLDQFLWGMYNILFFWFVIMLVRRIDLLKKSKQNLEMELNTLSSKTKNGEYSNIFTSSS